MSYSEYLCKENDFQLRRPYLSEMQYVEKAYTPISYKKMLPLYLVGIVMCIVSYASIKNVNLYLLSEGVIKVLKSILLILPVIFTILTIDLYLNPRKAEDAMVTEVEIIKIHNYQKSVTVVPLSDDISDFVDIWSDEQKKYAVYVTSGELHFHEGDKGLLIKHPRRNGLQRFIVWEKDKYSVIKKS